MLRKLYDRVIKLSESRQALPTLALVSFAESSFFPIPPDVVLVPMALAQPEKARLYALVCTVASVLGGILGYFIGAFLYDTVGHWLLISAYGYGDSVEAFRAAYAKWGAWIILIKGLTPIPYKIVTIASGFAGYDFFMFGVLSTITRGARFFLEAELLRIYGEPIRDFVEKRLTLVTTGFLAAIVGGFFIAKYAF
jgi:membrane protein YqaA with SNARE-associated domain